MLRVFSPDRFMDRTPVVITGIGIVTAIGSDRESVWQAVRDGRSGIQPLVETSPVPSWLRIAAVVGTQPSIPKQLKVIHLAHQAAAEAMSDSGVDLQDVDRTRFACAVSGHMGDWHWLRECHQHAAPRREGEASNWDQFLPNSGCWDIATHYDLRGPRLCHSTACASGLIDILNAARTIQDGQADIALAGSAEAIDPLFAAGFRQMRVLADVDDPRDACRPFDRHRTGFVMGEGAAMFVVERLDHALARHARIYAEIAAGRMLADAHHMTGLDIESDSLTRLISDTLRAGSLVPSDIGYVNAHGTGTIQNDLMETRGIRRALGSCADSICVSSLKSMLGHLVNASGSVELALTTLALRDGFVPPTLNLRDPDPDCDLDCVPLVGRENRIRSALKLSLAFGGHLVAVALRRWNDAKSGFAYPAEVRRAA
jgi:3-oxoacyl-(acyl-carrier-protein) synthase